MIITYFITCIPNKMTVLLLFRNYKYRSGEILTQNKKRPVECKSNMSNQGFRYFKIDLSFKTRYSVCA